MKYFDINGHKSYFDISKYVIGERPALMLCNKATDEGYPVSVNLLDDNEKPIVPEDCIAFDVNNVEPEVYAQLLQFGFLEEVGIKSSGFCLYPVCRLNMKKVKEYAV